MGAFEPYFDFLYDSESIRNGYWYRNVVGTSILSVSEDDTSYYPPIPAGVYQFTFSSSTELTVSYVLDDDNGNPLMGGQTVTVTNDGVTEHTTLIMGFAVVISPTASAGDVSQIGIGCKLTEEGSLQRILNLGVALEGVAGSTLSLSVQNLTGEALSGCQICVRNGIVIANSRFDDTQGGPIQTFFTADIHNYPSDTDIDGNVITFDDVDSGPPITVDMLYEGAQVSVFQNGTTYEYGTGLSVDTWSFCDALEIGLTGVDGLFKFVDEPLVTDEATVYHSDGGSCVEISTGSGYVSNGELIDLTEDGEDTGVITNEGIAEFTIRVNPPSGSVANWSGWRCFDIAVTDDTGYAEVITGSLYVLPLNALGSLVLRVSSFKEQYDRPRFTKVGAAYVPDTSGTYVESLTAPGTYILRTADPDGGLYTSYEAVLAASGVTIA